MLRALCRNAGIKPRRLLATLRGVSRYFRDRHQFRSLVGHDQLPWGKEFPILTEWDDASGGTGAYFLQDLTVARWILEASPVRHVDVGSRIDGFIGHLAVFRELDVLDIRPSPGHIPGVTFHQLNLMEPLPESWIHSTDSLSCLHTIEHFGLGRYGDPLDPSGHIKGLSQLKQLVVPGGRLYLSTPIGRERVEFNAHRIFSPATMTGWFELGWRIEKVAWIDESCQLHESATLPSDASGVGMLVARKC